MNLAWLGEGGFGVEEEGQEEEAIKGGNPVPAKWLIPLIP